MDMTKLTGCAVTALVLASPFAPGYALAAQEVDLSAVGPSPYDVVSGWHMPFAQPGYAFGGNSGVFAESPDRIFILQRGETRLPDPVPAEFAGYAGSIGINVLRDTERRVWQNCIYTLNGEGEVQERWTQWDHLCEGSDGPGPHRIRINPYDPERRVWVVHETFHQIYVFSNDGSEHLMTLGEKGWRGTTRRTSAGPRMSPSSRTAGPGGGRARQSPGHHTRRARRLHFGVRRLRRRSGPVQRDPRSRHRARRTHLRA